MQGWVKEKTASSFLKLREGISQSNNLEMPLQADNAFDPNLKPTPVAPLPPPPAAPLQPDILFGFELDKDPSNQWVLQSRKVSQATEIWTYKGKCGKDKHFNDNYDDDNDDDISDNTTTENNEDSSDDEFEGGGYRD